MSFKKLGLCPELLTAISEQGYTEPTPIQSSVIPAVLEGGDVMAAAQTGTGKTAGFTLPLLQRLMKNLKLHPQSKRVIRALILTPTRELADQVANSVKDYGRHLPFKSAVIFGGMKFGPQIAKLRQGVDIVIATPGRLLDLIDQNALQLSSVEILVLDEADRMLDMGFIVDIRKILRLLPKQPQCLLFSATLSKEVKTLANTLMKSPLIIEAPAKALTADDITQQIYLVDRKRKRELLSHMIGSNNWKQVLVFTRTKRGADQLTKQLNADGLVADAIHGNKSQAARTKALAKFKEGKTRVLVATDVAARGIDINKLPHVVNFDMPLVAQDYVHRIGRTGRAQNKGSAISLVSHEEKYLLRDIEKLLKMKLPQEIPVGYEYTGPNKSDDQEDDLPAARKNQRRTPRKPTNRSSSRRGASNKSTSHARPSARTSSATPSRGRRKSAANKSSVGGGRQGQGRRSFGRSSKNK